MASLEINSHQCAFGFVVFKPISDADVIVNKNILSVLLNKLYIGR